MNLLPPRHVSPLRWWTYLWFQWRHTRGKREKDATFRIRPGAEALAKFLPAGARVLDLGCRNRVEPALLRTYGWQVEPVDLFPAAPGIRKADMHRLPYPDGSFDAVFASHVLEHAYEPQRALSEIARVLKPGGLLYVQVPRGFTPGRQDRWDYEDVETLLAFLPPRAFRALEWDEIGDNWFRAVIRVGAR